MTTPEADHRIHLAANDPAFPAQREAAFAVIVAAVAAVAEPAGYALRGTTWTRETAAGRTAINLQRSRYGFDVAITLRFLQPDGSPLETGEWTDSPEITLAAFIADIHRDPGVISYLDVHENAGCLDRPLAILRDRALPWLDAHHSGHCLPISPRPMP
jgi:hypothetical protein